VIKEWWNNFSHAYNGEVPIEEIKKFVVKMNFAPDLDIAEKLLNKRVGHIEIYTRSSF